jgi:hypothetical protein
MNVKNAILALNGITAQLITRREQLHKQYVETEWENDDDSIPITSEYIDIDSTIEILTDAIEQIKTYK